MKPSSVPPKPLPFEDHEVIKKRAHALWESRSDPKDGDWHAAEELLRMEYSLAQKTELERQKLNLERAKAWLSGAGVVAAILAGVGLYLMDWNDQEQQRSVMRLMASPRVDSATLPTIHVQCPGVAANFRAAPTLSSQVLGVVQDGDLVELTTERQVMQDGVMWASVRFRGQTGWMASKFLGGEPSAQL